MTQTIEAVVGASPVERERCSPPEARRITRSASRVQIDPQTRVQPEISLSEAMFQQESAQHIAMKQLPESGPQAEEDALVPYQAPLPELDKIMRRRAFATYHAARAGAAAAQHARGDRSPLWQRIFDAAERITFISGIDLVPLLDPGHDEEAWARLADHLRQVVDGFGPSPVQRPADEVEAEAARREPRPRELRAALDWVARKELELEFHAPNIDGKLKGDLQAELKSFRRSLEAVQGNRLVRGMLLPVTLLLGAPVAALSYLAHPQQLRGAVLMMASVLKTLVWTAGAVARSSTDWSTARYVLVHRHFTNLEETALQIPLAGPTEKAEEISLQTGYLVGVVGISFMLTMLALFGKKVWTWGRDTLHRTPPRPASAETRAFLANSSEETREIRAAVDDFFRGYTDSGARVSNTGNIQQNRMLDKGERLMTLFLKANGIDARAIAKLHAAKNRDALPKFVRMLAYDLINGIAILPFVGDRIAMGTMIADWFITASILGDEWWDSSVNDLRMEESGQSWVALSATLIVPMGINRILDIFKLGIEAGGVSGVPFKAFGGVVGGGNLVFPRWIGLGVNKMVSAAVNRLRSGDKDGATRALDTATWITREMYKRGVLDGQLGDVPTAEQQASVERIVQEAQQRELSLHQLQSLQERAREGF